MTRPLLAMTREALQERVERGASDPLLGRLATWFAVATTAPAALPPHTGVWTYQEVATTAMEVALGGSADTFGDGLAWLTARKFFQPNRTWGLEGDPLAIFAIAIGVHRATGAESPHRAWVSAFAEQAAAREGDGWRKSLLVAAQALFDGSKWAAVVPDLVVALEERRLTTSSLAARESALRLVVGDIKSEPDERAVVRLAALRHLLAMEASLDLHRPTVGDVVDVLRRVPDALKRWPWASPRPRKPPQTWDILNEYDVQALLYAVLRPIFDDLIDEEHLKAIGYKHPRVDLAVPRIRLIIEVKYLYEATPHALSGVIEDVSADTGLYLSEDNGYDSIVAFVWDSTASVQHHGTLTAGLRKLNGVTDAVVVSRPGTWRSATTPPP